MHKLLIIITWKKILKRIFSLQTHKTMSDSDGIGTPRISEEFFACKINKRRRKLDSYEDEGEKSPKILRPIKKKKSSTSRFRRTQSFNETSTKALDKVKKNSDEISGEIKRKNFQDSKVGRYVLFKWVFKLALREFSVTVEGFKKYMPDKIKITIQPFLCKIFFSGTNLI